MNSETKEVDHNAALLEALKILSRRDYFREELRRRLLRKDFPKAAVEAAVRRCQDLGYLDDEALAVRFAESRAIHRGWSPLKIQVELRRRGVGEERARSASSISGELRSLALKKSLSRAEARAPKEWWRGRAGRRPLLSSLLRRGFDAEESLRAIEALAVEREGQHDEKTDEPGDPDEFS